MLKSYTTRKLVDNIVLVACCSSQLSPSWLLFTMTMPSSCHFEFAPLYNNTHDGPFGFSAEKWSGALSVVSYTVFLSQNYAYISWKVYKSSSDRLWVSIAYLGGLWDLRWERVRVCGKHLPTTEVWWHANTCHVVAAVSWMLAMLEDGIMDGL